MEKPIPKKEPRKIIQICQSSVYSPNFGDVWNLTALCNDGTVWDCDNQNRKWHKLQEIPQSEEA